MTKRVLVSICLVMILALFAGVVQAQQGTPTPRPTPTNVPPGGGDDDGTPPPETEDGETKGSIRGTVFNDQNADGVCADEPPLAGVPIKFVSDRGDTTVYLQSGANGTFGLVAAGLGTWTVTAEPSAGMIVTSQNPLQVFLGVDNTLALNVNFCIADGSITVAPTTIPTSPAGPSGPSRPSGPPPSQQPGTGTLFLPTAGAGIAPTLIVTGLTGASLILAGFGIELRRQRQNELEAKPKSKRKNKA